MDDWRDYGPDYSHVDSLEKAVAAHARGELEKVWLLPRAFGGQDVPENVVYAAPGTELMKRHVDEGVIAGLIQSGAVSRYRAVPEYQGSSMVPIALEIVASDPGSYTSTLVFWGEALVR
jgi:hypothetical protein